MTDLSPQLPDDDLTFIVEDDEDENEDAIEAFLADSSLEPEAATEPETHAFDEAASDTALTRSGRRRAERDSGLGEVTPVRGLIGARLEGKDIHADADYAEVTETGITYVVRLGEGLLAEILVGGAWAPEDAEFPRESLKTLVEDLKFSKLVRHFNSVYGAELVLENAYGALALKFHLPYDEAGVEESSVEYMGYRVQRETPIAQAQMDNLVNAMVPNAAAALNYVWSAPEQRYVKAQVTSFSATREQYKLMQDHAVEFYALSNKSVTSSRGKWTRSAELYSAAANRAYDIGSRVRKSDLSVEGQLRRESSGYRIAAGSEVDATTRETYLDLADRFAAMAVLAEQLS